MAEALRAASVASSPRTPVAEEAGDAERAPEGDEELPDTLEARSASSSASAAQSQPNETESAGGYVGAEQQNEEPKKTPGKVGNACEYWRTMTQAMAEARTHGEEAMKRSYLRDIPATEHCDP